MVFTSTEERRKVNWEDNYERDWVDESAMQRDLLEQGFHWEDELHTDLSNRNLELASRTLVPPQHLLDESKTGVIFCHGYGGHLRGLSTNIFLSYASKLNALVTGLEIEGHGLSDKTHGLVTDIDSCVDEIHQFIKRQLLKFPQVQQWFLHGESMGGCCVLLESLKISQELRNQQDTENDLNRIKGMILSAPMCRVAEEAQPNFVMKNILLVAAKLFPTWAVVPSSFSDKDLFKRDDIKLRIRDDPLRYMKKPRLATAVTVLHTTKRLNDRLGDIDLPFIVLHGEKDLATQPQGSRDLFSRSKRVAEEDKKLVLVEDAMHGLFLSEPEEVMDQLWTQVFDWIHSRTQHSSNKSFLPLNE